VAGRRLLTAANEAAAAGSLGCEREREEGKREERRKTGLCDGLNP
jgi:hypothetical protein